MWLKILTFVSVLSVSLFAFSGCSSRDEGSAIMERSHQASRAICDVLGTISDKESAEAAKPRLKELIIEKKQAKSEFRKYQKAHPGFEQKYMQESMRVMNEWGSALAGIHSNENIPEDVRMEIMSILSH